MGEETKTRAARLDGAHCNICFIEIHEALADSSRECRHFNF